MNKKLLIILGISLAANFILIGFETAKIIYQPAFPDIPPERPRFVRPEGKIPGGLDFQDQKLMREAFKAAVKNHDKEMESARQEVEDALKSEPFDTEKFKSAMQKATDVRSTIDAAVQENMVGLLSKMTPEERRSFADRFSRKGQPGFHGKSGRTVFLPNTAARMPARIKAEFRLRRRVPAPNRVPQQSRARAREWKAPSRAAARFITAAPAIRFLKRPRSVPVL